MAASYLRYKRLHPDVFSILLLVVSFYFFLDSVILVRTVISASVSNNTQLKRDHVLPSQGGVFSLYCSNSEPVGSDMKTVASATVGVDSHRQELQSTRRKDAKLFVTTLNCGGIKDLSGLGGAVEDWIPKDYDIYCIGFQECLALKEFRWVLDLIAAGIGCSWCRSGFDDHVACLSVCWLCRSALHEHLGVREYTMYHSAIGDATVLHGEISLVLFARAR